MTFGHYFITRSNLNNKKVLLQSCIPGISDSNWIFKNFVMKNQFFLMRDFLKFIN
jgi:hypothetical protein